MSPLMLMAVLSIAGLVSGQDSGDIVELDPIQLNCTQAMMTCSNGGYIRQSDCMTKFSGPYESYRTTVCTCSEGYGGQGCDFVVNSSVCLDRNLSLVGLPGPNQHGSLGCRIDSDMTSSFLNLIDHHAFLDFNLSQSTMMFSIESRNTDVGFYSDVAEVIRCSLSQCQFSFDDGSLLSSITCNVHPEDCTGRLPGDDLFLPSLTLATANFLSEDREGRVKMDIVLQSLYPLPLNMKCLAGRCG